MINTYDIAYEHMISLFIALCKQIVESVEDLHGHIGTSLDHGVWRSKTNSDGVNLGDWFLLGIEKEFGKQIRYYIPIYLWDDADFAETLDQAPDFDGHTHSDILNRLKNRF